MRLHTFLSVAASLLLSVSAFASDPPKTPAPGPPTAVEMAPLVIPTTSLPQSDFALRLSQVCGSLSSGSASSSYPPAPKPFKAADLAPAATPTAVTASLSGLNQACSDIGNGTTLTALDIATLKEFRDNAATVQDRIAALLAKAKAAQQTAVPPDLTSSGSLESDIIEGLAQFIYDRAKQEGTLYLSRELSEKLCDDAHKLFFPRVCVALAVADPPIPLGAMASYLVAAARADLDALPDRLLAYTLHYQTAPDQASVREGLFGARIGLAYYRTVRTGRTPFDVARCLHGMDVPTTVVGHDTKVLKGFKIASELLDSVHSQQGWSTVTSPTAAVAKYYALGVIFTFEAAQQTDGTLVGSFDPDRVAALVPVVAQYLADAVALFNRVQTAKLALSTPATSVPSGDFKGGGGQGGTASGLTMLDYTAAVTQTLEQALDGATQIAQQLGVTDGAVASLLKDARRVADIGENIVGAQSPADVLMLAVNLVDQLASSAGPAVSSSVPVKDVEQLLALIAQIAQAKSADEVETVLETAGASASTYAIKYQHHMVAIGALAGAAIGVESVHPNGTGWSTGGMVGAFAPIGFTASTPLNTWFHGGVMLSLINVGTLVSARFSQDTTSSGTTMATVQTTQPVKFTNVLAPGLFLTLGIARSPLSLAFGAQVVPLARDVSVTTAGTTTPGTSTVPAVQIVGALSMDVPLFVF